MIIDYQLAPDFLPSDREVLLYTLELERLGIKMSPKLIRMVERGELKVYKGEPVQWCSDCADFHYFKDFEVNKKRLLKISKICKAARSRRRRIKEFTTINFVSDSGLKNETEKIKKNISEKTLEKLL